MRTEVTEIKNLRQNGEIGKMSTKDILKPSEKMIKEMDKERKKCKDLVDREPESEEIRRIVIRSLFSIIEGMCYRMKVNAFLIGRLREIEFTKEELAMINEETYYLNEKGEARIRDFFPSLKSNLRFAFKILAKVFKSDFELVIENAGFENFQKAIDIRNRITHPKGIKDLDISQNDFNNVLRAYGWFISNMRKLSEKIEGNRKRRRG